MLSTRHEEDGRPGRLGNEPATDNLPSTSRYLLGSDFPSATSAFQTPATTTSSTCSSCRLPAMTVYSFYIFDRHSTYCIPCLHPVRHANQYAQPNASTPRTGFPPRKPPRLPPPPANHLRPPTGPPQNRSPAPPMMPSSSSVPSLVCATSYESWVAKTMPSSATAPASTVCTTTRHRPT